MVLKITVFEITRKDRIQFALRLYQNVLWTVLMRATTYVFMELYGKLSLNYASYPFLSGAQIIKTTFVAGGMQHGGQHGGMQPGGTHHGVMSGGQLSGMSGMHYQQPMRGATDTK